MPPAKWQYPQWWENSAAPSLRCAFSNVATTFAASDALLFGLSARVGGANQTTLVDNLVNQTPVAGFLGCHEMIAIKGLFNRFQILAGVLDINLVEATLQLDDVLGMAFDI